MLLLFTFHVILKCAVTSLTTSSVAHRIVGNIKWKACTVPHLKCPTEKVLFYTYIWDALNLISHAIWGDSNSVMPVGVFVNSSITALEGYHGIEQRITHLYPIALRLITLGPIRSTGAIFHHTHNQHCAQPLARDNASLHPLPDPECFTLLRPSDGLSQVWQRQIARRTGSYQA